ncbi:MAG TPA: polymer-forming cytoskeletal protein, partial [Candidatus Sulfotelmatobacter sp.]|nr:polymer-forming cytoskeletal protein [Candidatus Sulfotelmatobacter sp.]
NMGLFNNISSGKKGVFSGGVDSVVGENARFKGELISSGSVNINGEFEGKIRAEGEVIISPAGKVVGEIYGGTVIISGRVDGNIVAKESLEVAKSGRVHGDLTGGKIIIEDGSSYHGRVKVESGAPEPEQPDQPSAIF